MSRQRISRNQSIQTVSPIRFRVSLILGMGQTSKAPVQAINRMKSNANLHLPSGLGTIRTWLHIGAWLASMTPRQSKASTCSLIAVCISMLWCQGGSRLRETSHFPLSTTIITGSTLADWCLTLIEKITMYFSQSFLGFAWNPTEPSKRIMANNSYRVSVFWSSR